MATRVTLAIHYLSMIISQVLENKIALSKLETDASEWLRERNILIPWRFQGKLYCDQSINKNVNVILLFHKRNWDTIIVFGNHFH